MFEYKVIHFRVGMLRIFEFRISLRFRVKGAPFSSSELFVFELGCFVFESGCFVFEVRVFLFRVQGRLLRRVGSLRSSAFVYDYLVFKTTIGNITVKFTVVELNGYYHSASIHGCYNLPFQIRFYVRFENVISLA